MESEASPTSQSMAHAEPPPPINDPERTPSERRKLISTLRYHLRLHLHRWIYAMTRKGQGSKHPQEERVTKITRTSNNLESSSIVSFQAHLSLFTRYPSTIIPTAMSVSPEYSPAPLRLLMRPVASTVPAVREEEVDGRLILPEEPRCTTPTSEEFRLPEVPRSCPPAPRKPPRAIRCKRRLSELEFVVVRREEMESLFRRRGCDPVPSQPAKKKKLN